MTFFFSGDFRAERDLSMSDELLESSSLLCESSSTLVSVVVPPESSVLSPPVESLSLLDETLCVDFFRWYRGAEKKKRGEERKKPLIN